MAPRKPRAPKAAPLPPALPGGLVVADLKRRSWRLGTSIGSGGFGQIYSASLESAACPGLSAGAQYVIKVEAHASGPLFSEMHCYHRVARAETIAAWQSERRLRLFGMPRFIASGSFDHGGQKFRFMVIERFGTDLQKLLEQNNNRFPMPTILLIGIQVLEVLEFIHSQEYIHGDIKGQNLLLGLTKDTKDLVYLVDFGLACRYASDGVHKEYKPDVRKAHNGTIEFTSRDAHIGAQSRRGDLEILGYNLLQWASGTLPWMDRLQSADKVADEKNRQMANVPGLMKACFPKGLPKGAEAIQRFLSAVAALKFADKPDYAALKAMLQAGLRTLGNPPARLVFTTDTAAASPRKSAARRDRSPLQPVQESAAPRRRPAAAKRPGRGRAARAASPDPSPSPEDSGDDQEEAEDEPRPLANGRGRAGRGGRKGRKRTSSEREEEEEEAAGPAPGPSTDGEKRRKVNGKANGSTKSSIITISDSNSSIYDNINPAMQEVLDRRAKAEASKAKTTKAKLQPKPAPAAASRARGKGRAAAAASPAAGRKVASPVAGRKVASPAVRAAGRRAASPRSRAARPDVSGDGGDDDEESFHTPSGTPGLRRSGRRSSGAGPVSPLALPRRAIRGNDFSPELW